MCLKEVSCARQACIYLIIKYSKGSDIGKNIYIYLNVIYSCDGTAICIYSILQYHFILQKSF